MESRAMLEQRLARPASRMVVGGFRPSNNLFTSWFGKVTVCSRDEEWPHWEHRPLRPLCQIACHELPYHPPIIEDIGIITIFVSEHSVGRDAKNGDGWLLRTHRRSEELVPLVSPVLSNPIRQFPVRWEIVDHDFPVWTDIDDPSAIPASIAYSYSELFPNADHSKVGGWPSLIEGPLQWDVSEYEYTLQITTEPKAHWSIGDSGTLFIGMSKRGGRHHWRLEWQCY